MVRGIYIHIDEEGKMGVTPGGFSIESLEDLATIIAMLGIARDNLLVQKSRMEAAPPKVE